MTGPEAPAPGAFDLDYAIDEDIPSGPLRADSQFIFARLPQLVTKKATSGNVGRVLDVGCGFGAQMKPLFLEGWETWGLDASPALAQYCRNEFVDAGGAPVVCGVAERLPFEADSFDRLICQGSLDHFAKPRAFMREVARVLRPSGRAVIAIANYDSLSCRLGRTLFLGRQRLGLPVYQEQRHYWEIPANHTFRGTYQKLVALGGPCLDLIECRGVSLFWLFRRWTWLTERLPRPIAWSAMTAADRIAYRSPQLADMMVSVWRPSQKRHAGA